MKTNDLRNRNWFWPLVIIGGSIMVLLKAFGIGEQYTFYQIFGSILLISVAIDSLIRFRFFMFLVPLSLILYIWRTPLGFADLNIKYLLLATIGISIGLSLIFRKKPAASCVHKKHGEWSKTEEILNENENVIIESNFSEQTKYIHATNLKKAQISSNFASTKVYFDQCQISAEGLEINVQVSFSGVILMVPKDWRIENRISTFAGTVTSQSNSAEFVPNLVRLTGNLNFGEVKILEL